MKAVKKGLLKQKAIEQSADFLINLNKKSLKKGELSTQEQIRPVYKSEEYAGFKQSLNSTPEYGTPDLLLSGDFQASFFIQTVKDGENVNAKIDAKDWKTAKLKGRYTKDIMGIQKADQKEAQAHVTNNFLKEYKKAVGL